MEDFHQPVEEYLETILELQEEGVPIIAARIAERLKRSAPSVSEMIERLFNDGFLIKNGRSIQLTPKGLELAQKVVRRHRLAERLLVDIIGLEWHKAHQEAGKWEHVISDEVEQRLVLLLDNPTTCPHGNPIPGAKPLQNETKLQTLGNVTVGAKVILRRVTEKVEFDFESLKYLDSNGVIPGKEFVVKDKSPDGGVYLENNGKGIVIGPQLGKELFVELIG
jgi:DtxR family Mn-dependent transcriptional regulator